MPADVSAIVAAFAALVLARDAKLEPQSLVGSMPAEVSVAAIPFAATVDMVPHPAKRTSGPIMASAAAVRQAHTLAGRAGPRRTPGARLLPPSDSTRVMLFLFIMFLSEK